jgi:hypothetical protein
MKVLTEHTEVGVTFLFYVSSLGVGFYLLKSFKIH